MNSQDLRERAELLERVEQMESWINQIGIPAVEWVQAQAQREQQMMADLQAQKQKYAKPKQPYQSKVPSSQMMQQSLAQMQQQNRSNMPYEQQMKMMERQAANVYAPSNDPNDYVDDGLPTGDDDDEVPNELPPLNDLPDDSKKPKDNKAQPKPAPRVLWNR